MFVAFFATGKILGRRNKRDESEDLPVHLDDWYLQDTGVNQNLFFQSLFFEKITGIVKVCHSRIVTHIVYTLSEHVLSNNRILLPTEKIIIN